MWHFLRLTTGFSLITFTMLLPLLNEEPHLSFNDLYYAIAEIESHNSDSKIGPKGELGRYQISQKFWLESKMSFGKFADCKEDKYAKHVIWNYWQNNVAFAVRDKNMKVLALNFKYGSAWQRYENSNEGRVYWQKIQIMMKKGK